jgi:DNA repair protein RadC
MPREFLYDSAAQSVLPRCETRERIIREGVAALPDRELLAALLGSGMRGKRVQSLADEVLALIDGLEGPPEASYLQHVSGMGQAKACAVSAALELGRRLYGFREKRIVSPRDLWPLVAHWADRTQERFICCALNGAHEVIAVRVVSVGLVNRTVVHPREVFADPIVDRACAVIVGHNHPSGRLEPSPEDIEITNRLKESGNLLGISLLDHLVFSSEGYYSFVEHGLLSIPPPD